MMAKRFRWTMFLLVVLAPATIRSQNSTVARMIDSVSAERLEVHLGELQKGGGHGTRVNFTPGLDSAVEYVYREFMAMPGLASVFRDTFFVSTALPPYNTKPMFNVVATLPGRKQPPEIVVIGAHIDACGSKMPEWNTQWQSLRVPGADDNASGVAAVLEAARIMSDTSFGYAPEHTVVFIAFGVEETAPVYSGWTFGSLHYAQKARERGENIRGMISADMLGFNGNHAYLAIVTDSASRRIADGMTSANRDFGIGLTLEISPRAYTWSDHASFWTYGFPAVCLIESAPPTVSHQWYTANSFFHTGGDSLGTVNMHLVRQATQLLIAAGAEMETQTNGIERRHNGSPDALMLGQNFPNPFNPSTDIRFTLFRGGWTSLRVYDVLGREKAVLTNEMKTAGTYSLRFDASRLPSGIYWYRLSNGGATQTKKMILMR